MKMSQMIQNNISDSPELRLLRQDNLQFYAEINARAFSGASMGEIPITAYLKIIDEVKGISVDGDFTKPAKFYLDRMLGKCAGYDRKKAEAWIGTDIRGDTEMVVLLEAGARALRILRDLEADQSFLAVSSLSSLTDRITQVVARLSGDVSQQIDALEARREEIDREIAGLKARGATPLTHRERQTEIFAVLNDISQIRAGFAEVPGARRRINRENQDLFLESDAPVGQVLDVFFEHTKAWEESGESAILSTLRDMHVDIQKGQQLQTQLEAMAEECADTLDPRHRRDIVSFLPDMLEISSDITVEISNIWKAVHAYISNPNYTAKRADARALRDAQAAATRVRTEVQPSPRDSRLKEIGLLLTEPLRTAPQSDLRLTLDPPEAPKEDKHLTPAESLDDEDPAILMMAREKARSAYLSKAAMTDRIAQAMGEADNVTLSDVLRRFPLRYGRHEICCYLTLASSHHPSLLVEGMSFLVRMTERNIVSAANIPNPIFRRTGEIGEGFGSFQTIDHLLHPDTLRTAKIGIEPIDRILEDASNT